MNALHFMSLIRLILILFICVLCPKNCVSVYQKTTANKIKPEKASWLGIDSQIQPMTNLFNCRSALCSLSLSCTRMHTYTHTHSLFPSLSQLRFHLFYFFPVADVVNLLRLYGYFVRVFFRHRYVAHECVAFV